ncbi:beta-1,3-galactosyltransferase 1-like [Patiria miniata]|uniref:Hexosyltransferase n=1 Tax=Patiria miniata TaxID=46514 RepID=A0A914AAR4_PATMI|nr:beta-1,3-galactosyltransferase 1-like [Patiria miniata]
MKPTETSSNQRDDSRQIINPHEYKLRMDEPQACYDAAGTPEEVFLLVLIFTVHLHTQQRKAIRETWGSPREIKGKKVVTLFLLAQNQYAYLQQRVEKESNKHHDLLQEDFQDTYNNLTLKTIMAMKWASTHCPHASYVMKTDDDSYVSYDNLVKHLTRSPSTNYAVGRLYPNAAPFRDPGHKWYMSKELYPGRVYLPYLSGAGYVISGELTGKIYEESLQTRYLHLEDVFVAICLKSLKVQRRNNYYFTCQRQEYSYCRFRQLISAHKLRPTEMYRIWRDQKRRRRCSLGPRRQ